MTMLYALSFINELHSNKSDVAKKKTRPHIHAHSHAHTHTQEQDKRADAVCRTESESGIKLGFK